MPPVIPFPNDAPNTSAIENEVPAQVMSDSDSFYEDEDEDFQGYKPLSQDPDNDNEEDNCASEEFQSHSNSVCVTDNLPPQPESRDTSETTQKNLEMDDERIETIKSVMKGISLPESNVPAWASKVSEQEWKSVLLSKMSKKNTASSTDHDVEEASR